ncbi:MAG TPA: hypothetical protein DCO75_09500 [Fibrobacteres bacterium]|nr:hypothetical protein [Fibrobacterota bacterium]
MQFIFRNIDKPTIIIAAAAIASTAVQCIFLREYLAVFSGNELVVGVVLSIWLCAAGTGSIKGQNVSGRFLPIALTALLPLAIFGLYCIRASRLFFSPGELIGPLPVIGLCVLSEAPFAFVNGYIFGMLSGNNQTRNSYGLESLGALIGSILTYICVLFYLKNSIMILFAILPFFSIFLKRKSIIFPAIAAMVLLFCLNDISMHWKYPFSFSGIIYGREGEIVRINSGSDSTYMLNGILYKSTAEKAIVEQAVHIPMAQRIVHGNALVIFDKGHYSELALYPGLHVDQIETEPKISSHESIITAPETYKPEKLYDMIFLGAGMPQTAATGRYYTISFFKHIKSIMTDSGIFSFTLPFSENYMSHSEKQQFEIIQSTLKNVFKNTLVFPGAGFTFMASDVPLHAVWTPQVKTRYLASSIIPAVSAERISAANMQPLHVRLNTAQQPLGLLMGFTIWIEQFEKTASVAAGIFLTIILLSIFTLPKNRGVFSMGTTGFVTGVYSIALMLLYQSAFGLLYSRVSLLMMSLTSGFVLGTLMKRLKHYDLLIGLYCFVSLGLLSLMAYPPAVLFYCANILMGVLTGGQFVAIKKTPAASLYAADLCGGALGMALCSTVLAPVFGIIAVAGWLCVLKVLTWFSHSI